MSNFFSLLLVVFAFLAWKVLDYFALPNTFSILLLFFTLVSGSFWCFHRFFVLPKRKRKLIRAEQRGMSLSEEEKKQIEPISVGSESIASLFPVLLFVFALRSFVFEPFQIPSGSMEPTLLIGDFLIVEKYAYGIKDPIFQNTIIPIEHPKRGDVVVFKAPPEPSVDYIKRVIGLPGDKIVYDQIKGTLTITEACEQEICPSTPFNYVDAKPNPEFIYYNQAQIQLTEVGSVSHQILLNPERFNYVFYDYYNQEGLPIGEWVVQEGHYFVMGDNRDNSKDSRFWGFVPEQALVGKASRIWLSLDKKANEWPSGIRTERFWQKIE